jgi:hypothetical protein
MQDLSLQKRPWKMKIPPHNNPIEEKRFPIILFSYGDPKFTNNKFLKKI